MELWTRCWVIIRQLRPAFRHLQTFLWFGVCLAGMMVRMDLWGVTSIVRGLGLKEKYYDRILDFYHSKSLNLELLTNIWIRIMCEMPFVTKVNGRLVLICDGIKIPKSGLKMPAVKSLYQSSESNTKPEYIDGHSFQAVAVLAGSGISHFAMPLVSRIHEGLVFSNRSCKTLLDKMADLLINLAIPAKYYLVADSYYACQKMVKALLANGQHLISRVRTNAVAYYLPEPETNPHKRGRKKIYGKKVRLKDLLKNESAMQPANSPVYGEENVMIRFFSIDLLWCSAQTLVRFVLVLHPHRGSIILLSTDLTLDPLGIIRLYGWRFKIEVSFKQALRTIGAYAYHFWMGKMSKRKRHSGDQYLHKKNEDYRVAITRKIKAYHCFVQIGLIAQGLLQYLSLSADQLVWKKYGSWMRTFRPGIHPSEAVTSIAMRNTLPEFLAGNLNDATLQKFILERIDFERSEGIRLVA